MELDVNRQEKNPPGRLNEIEYLRTRLEEAEETLEAIRRGEVDALVVSGPHGDQVYTLQGAERPYRVLLENIQEGAASLAENGTILFANKRLAEILQLPLEELIGSALKDFISPPDRKKFADMMERTAAGTSGGELRLLARDRTAFPAHLSLAGLPDRIGIALTVRDLSQERRDAKTLARARLTETILDQAGQMIIICDVHGRIVRASQQTWRYKNNILRRPFDDVFPLKIPGADGTSRFFSVFDVLHREASFDNLEISFAAPEGELRMLLNARPLHHQQNKFMGRFQKDKIIGCVLVLTDITEQKRTEEALRQNEGHLKAAQSALEESRDQLEMRIQERTAQLLESEKRFRCLADELLNAQEKERKRIAQEIHDSMTAQLAAVKYRLEREFSTGSDPKAGARIRDIAAQTQNVIEETRRIMANLRPPILDDLGLLPTIEWFCREFKIKNPEIEFERKIEVRENKIPENVKVVFFRLLQEALNNVRNHSAANRVKISLVEVESHIALTVEDNGKGFSLQNGLPAKKMGGGFGLSSMQEGVEIAGGTFEIKSSPGQGTRVRATWKIAPAPKCTL